MKLYEIIRKDYNMNLIEVLKIYIILIPIVIIIVGLLALYIQNNI